jgi:hypothetical protein
MQIEKVEIYQVGNRRFETKKDAELYLKDTTDEDEIIEYNTQLVNDSVPTNSTRIHI